MATSTVPVNFRMDKDVKEKFEALCKDLGLNMSTAFNIFANTMIRQRKIPFEVSLDYPNEATLKAMDDMVNGRNLVGPFDNAKEVMEYLNAED